MRNIPQYKTKKKKTFKNTKLEEMSIGHMRKDLSMTTVYVGNLSYSKTEKCLLNIFKKYGHVGYVRINRDKVSKKSKGIAFIQMRVEKEALKAISELNGKQVDGRTLKASIAIESPKKKTKRNRFR